MFETTLAGSLPKPSWLATPNVLWAPWTLTGAPLQEAKEDATALSIRRQEEAGQGRCADEGPALHVRAEVAPRLRQLGGGERR